MNESQEFFEAILNNSKRDFKRFYKKEYLELTYKNKKPIHYSCIIGNFEITKSLIDHKCNIEAKDKEKRRPIHYACENENYEIVKLLLKNRCNIEARDINNERPLHIACSKSNVDIIKLLIKNKCKIEIRNKKDWRPVHYACTNGNIKILKILIKNHCSIEARDKWNKRPVHLASQNGFVNIVNLLIKSGCNFEAKDRWNKRPSHWSCEYGEIESLKILLENLCDIEAVDKNNRRPIHWACQNNRLDIINVLIEQQCQLNVIDSFGISPFDIAKEKGDSVMNDVLLKGEHVHKLISVLELKCLTDCDHSLCPKALHLKEFRTGDLIGKGGFGKVYRYKKSISNREFAAKFILIEKTNYKYIEENINKYKDQLNHRRIIKYFGAIETFSNLCIFMEYLAGGSLRDKLGCFNPFTENKIILYSKQILEGIAFLHNNNVIHRDIKPDNILLENDDNIKIADLGIGRMLLESENILHMASTCVGTRLYMAPEIFNRKPYTFSADIWSIGITVYEMNIAKNECNRLQTKQNEKLAVDYKSRILKSPRTALSMLLMQIRTKSKTRIKWFFKMALKSKPYCGLINMNWQEIDQN